MHFAVIAALAPRVAAPGSAGTSYCTARAWSRVCGERPFWSSTTYQETRDGRAHQRASGDGWNWRMCAPPVLQRDAATVVRQTSSCWISTQAIAAPTSRLCRHKRHLWDIVSGDLATLLGARLLGKSGAGQEQRRVLKERVCCPERWFRKQIGRQINDLRVTWSYMDPSQ